MKTFSEIQAHAISLRDSKHKRHERPIEDGYACQFGYAMLDIKCDYVQQLCGKLNLIPHVARFNFYGAEDFCRPHKDTAYPDCYTLLVTVEPDTVSRLSIDGELMDELEAGVIHEMPPLTEHAVSTGQSNRISLVIWAKPLKEFKSE